MPRPNVEIIQQAYDAFRRRDLPGVFALLAPDCEIAQSAELPWGGSFLGHEGAQQFLGRFAQQIESAQEFERFIDAGECVVAIGWTRGRVKATGAPFEIPVTHVWRIREGKITGFFPYIDNPTMLAALSAPPS